MMKRTQTCVLRGQPSSARNIDDQRGLTGELAEGNCVTFERVHGEFMERSHALKLRGGQYRLSTRRRCVPKPGPH